MQMMEQELKMDHICAITELIMKSGRRKVILK